MDFTYGEQGLTVAPQIKLQGIDEDCNIYGFSRGVFVKRDTWFWDMNSVDMPVGLAEKWNDRKINLGLRDVDHCTVVGILDFQASDLKDIKPIQVYVFNFKIEPCCIIQIRGYALY